MRRQSAEIFSPYIIIQSMEPISAKRPAGLKSLILAEVPNGTLINTTGRVAVADGITWYEITLASGSDPGWIAGSMIGR